MGQRLVNENIINGNTVNNIYYHWSAYTDSAADEVNDLYESVMAFYDEYKDTLPSLLKDESIDLDEFKKKNPIDFFNIACQLAISGVSSSSLASQEYIKKFFKDDIEVIASDRNNGLIAYTKNDISNNLSLSEGTVYIEWVLDSTGDIDVDNTTVDMFNLVFTEEPDDVDDDDKYLVKNLDYIDMGENPLCNIPIDNVANYIYSLPISWGFDNAIWNKIE